MKTNDPLGEGSLGDREGCSPFAGEWNVVLGLTGPPNKPGPLVASFFNLKLAPKLGAAPNFGVA